MSDILLEPGTLWNRVKAAKKIALASGALLSIPTECEVVEQDEVKFLVRVLSNLVRKDASKKQEEKQKDFNPFLPYEQDLWVADISETHVCILNKFNVVDNHLLIITRAFAEQESLLNPQDFAAMWACLTDFDGLAFYNGGKVAGASQRHKHLQIVPLPLGNIGVSVPIEPLFASAIFTDAIGFIPGLPFVHAFTWLNPDKTGMATWECYCNLLQAVGLKDGKNYNLLATRKWMLLVPRLCECFESISVNSLGFAGALLVRNTEQLQLLQEYRPMNILKSVTVPLS
ncbi:Ap4A phosphorylase II [Calothrix sp. NIES-4101]|nr:Ap4A phosphorylase II [Calothrix sp. NIES-4101]